MIATSEKFYENSGNQAIIDEILGENKTILDVGCGGGIMAQILRRKGHIIDGITISPKEAAAAKLYCRSVFVFNLENGLPTEISDKYDYVICSHVLEHICYPHLLLAGVKKHLKPDGLFLVALPNLMHYRSRWELVKGNFNYEESGVWDSTHFRWYTFSSAYRLLDENGFKIQKSWVTGEVPFFSILKYLPVSVRKCIFNLLTNISKSLFGGQLLYKCSI